MLNKCSGFPVSFHWADCIVAHSIAYSCSLWYGTVLYGMVRYVMVWYGIVQYGVVWYGLVRYCMVWDGTVRYDMVWYIYVATSATLSLLHSIKKLFLCWLVFLFCD